MPRREIQQLEFHRNGVGGLGFYVALVKDDDGSMKVVVRFVGGEEGTGPEADKIAGAVLCAVLDVDKLADGDIDFGSNSYRGDHYAPLMDEAIRMESHR